jgi:pimeloyl-ACP methyl ester carboxylesterase
MFIPGVGCGRRMAFGLEMLSEDGIRQISVDQPGIGVSTPDPNKTLDSVAADFAAVIDAFVGRQVSIANSQGAPFGLALAGTGHASRLVLVSPIDDLSDPPVSAQLPAAQNLSLADAPDVVLDRLCAPDS